MHVCTELVSTVKYAYSFHKSMALTVARYRCKWPWVSQSQEEYRVWPMLDLLDIQFILVLMLLLLIPCGHFSVPFLDR